MSLFKHQYRSRTCTPKVTKSLSGEINETLSCAARVRPFTGQRNLPDRKTDNARDAGYTHKNYLFHLKVEETKS